MTLEILQNGFQLNNNIPEVTLQLLDDSNTDADVNGNNETRTETTENKNENTTGTTTSITNEDHLNFEVDDFEKFLRTPIKETPDEATMSTNFLMMQSTSVATEKNSSNKGAILPSSFKRALFWPTPKEIAQEERRKKYHLLYLHCNGNNINYLMKNLKPAEKRQKGLIMIIT
ncbi:hypothetical protein HHI36_012102, partial [Cryptolaemus montrouzieri]